ncbi:hypothetical protein ACMV8I_10105 [Ewingella sp. S1.OA.A_B6]
MQGHNIARYEAMMPAIVHHLPHSCHSCCDTERYRRGKLAIKWLKMFFLPIEAPYYCI